jgi:hypothetical protein
MSLLILFDSEIGGGGLTITDVSDAIVPRRGGLVLEITGTGFESSAVVTLEQATVTLGTAYIFDPDFDVLATSIFAGLPPLPDGVYDLRVTVGADTVLAAGAIEYRLFAEESKVLRTRGGFAQPWRTGPRMLTNNTAGLAL